VSISTRGNATRRGSPSEEPASGALPLAGVTGGRAPATGGRGQGWRRAGWLRLISPVVVLALWQILSSTGVISQQKLPSLSTLWTTAVHLITTDSLTYGTLQHAMLVSLERVAIGFVIGGGLAVILATVAGQFLQQNVIFVALIVYLILGLLTDYLVRLIERRALVWRRGLLEGPGPARARWWPGPAG
jgi:ABC-type nitrate/sulfonate/bicarbonate transport system permease component